MLRYETKQLYKMHYTKTKFIRLFQKGILLVYTFITAIYKYQFSLISEIYLSMYKIKINDTRNETIVFQFVFST